MFQIIDRFDEAPVAFTLSALAAVVYIVATIALVAPGRFWYRVAWITITFELVGVLVIGTPEPLRAGDARPARHRPVRATPPSGRCTGCGYLFVPLVLPILGLLYLRTHGPRRAAGEGEAS